MKSLEHIDSIPGSLPLFADDLLEFHASRILLLLNLCGTRDRIEGLTKLAKLDFFVRYPSLFNRACEAQGISIRSELLTIDSAMIRFHYGPWDKRYYQCLSYLESRRLVEITQTGSTFTFLLTEDGQNLSSELKRLQSFEEVVFHMRLVKSAFGRWTGTRLKNLVYEVFSKEVAERELGEVITDGN